MSHFLGLETLCGGDYVTENENRHLKIHLPPGVPTLQSWINSSRNYQKLVKNYEEVFKKAGVTDQARESSSIFNFENEVKMLRIAIRQSGFYPIHMKRFPRDHWKEIYSTLI